MFYFPGGTGQTSSSISYIYEAQQVRAVDTTPNPDQLIGRWARIDGGHEGTTVVVEKVGNTYQGTLEKVSDSLQRYRFVVGDHKWKDLQWDAAEKRFTGQDLRRWTDGSQAYNDRYWTFNEDGTIERVYPGETTQVFRKLDATTQPEPAPQPIPAPGRFSDLDPDHWAHDNIMDMVERGILSGYPDGTFRPNNVVTRAEFARIMVLALELQTARPSAPTFSDVGTDHWAFGDVESAKDYLTGYQDRRTGELSFIPSGNAVREDVAVAIVKAQGYGNERANLGLLNQFPDQDEISNALRNHVAIAVEKGYMQGTNIGFEPQKPLTRAEACTLLLRIIHSGLEKVTL